jgi:hypothetical protein
MDCTLNQQFTERGNDQKITRFLFFNRRKIPKKLYKKHLRMD